jgi:hypothetical protein
MNQPEPDRIALTFKRYAAQVAVNEEFFLHDLDVQVQQEMVYGQLLLQLRTKILTDDLPPAQFTARDRVTFEVPASTWQMWKKRHADSWYARKLVARWPVRYEPDPDGRGADAVCTFDLERWRAYPRANVPLPPDRFGGAVHFHAVRGLRWNHEGETP